MIELAVTVDTGEPFVSATYKLEGNGPLAHYEILRRVNTVVQLCHLPNTTAVVKKLLVQLCLSSIGWHTLNHAYTTSFGLLLQ